ncbi:nitroreductase family protein [Chitinophaga polysaccharea]|uniref:nitroreductase family protein n=1 Tax=Chitinophaga polysaccharea TaxID=1293035 RepID=UPI00115B35DE|nr:nitroreductase [Chitinophaga polysaccharea]
MNNSDQVTLPRITDVEQQGEIISRIIRNRRSIYADEFVSKELPVHILQEILTNAIWAPTHKMTEPWRFIVLQGSQLEKFGNYMAAYYRSYYQSKMPEAAFETKYTFLRNYPLKAACMIAIILVRSKTISLPEWEEVAAISSAVHNMALTCTAFGLGSYWNTSGASVDYVTGLGLADNERSLGLMMVGYPDENTPPSKKRRTPVEQKVTWFT